MQPVVFFTILLGLSSLSAQPLNMNLTASTISTLNDNQINTTIATASDTLWIEPSKPVPTTKQIPSPKLEITENYAGATVLKNETSMDQHKTNSSNINSTSVLLKSSTESIIDNNQSFTTDGPDFEPRPVLFEPRLSAKLLKVLTILG